MLAEALAAAYAASAVLFAVLAARLARAYNALRADELLGLAWGFGLLAASSAAGAAEALSPSPRVSVTLYVATGSFSAAGLALILASLLLSRRAGATLASLPPAPLLAGVGLDAASAALALTAAHAARGVARAGLSALAAAHAARALAVALGEPWSPWTGAALVAAEALRAAGAGMLAAYYSGGVPGRGGEEE